MTTVYRILGKRGRITIPHEIRMRLGFRYNDVLSFTQEDDKTVIVRREKICNNCKVNESEKHDDYLLSDLIDNLSIKEQRELLIKLTLKWAEEAKA